MKKLLGSLLIFSSMSAILSAADSPKVEEKVVQLHILRANPPVTESVFKKRKSVDLKEKETGRGVCSGAFVSEYGHILTARHCVEDTVAIEVETYDQQLYNAKTIYISSTADLALLHINRRNTKYFRLAADVTRGESVYTLGSPLSIADTLSTGNVAKLWGDLMLVDLSVLPGNSGGPVFNENGDLVGVTTAGFIVFLGMTHLNIAQSLDGVYYFLLEAARHN